MHDDPLNTVDQFERTVLAVLKRLRRPAPAAVENSVGSGDACGMRCFSGAHDTNQSIDRGPRVATGKRADFDESLGHGVLLVRSRR